MYKHITARERKEIVLLLARKHSYADIARSVGVHRSTILREYQRNKDTNDTYRARSARKKALERHKGKQETNKIIENNEDLRRYVVSSLEKYWSPEQVSGRLKHHEHIKYVSSVSIYAYIQRERPDLKKYRRHKRHRRISLVSPKQALKRMIDARPTIINSRSRIGDWEGDTIVGKERRERILTHVDRRSGLLLAHRTQADSHSVRLVVREIFRTLPCSSITYDNGSEFAAFTQIEEEVDTEVYFAHPGKPHQRGTNENCNGLLRQFFPKGSSFVSLTKSDVDTVVNLINNRPRKRFNYRTPREVFSSEVGCCT